MSTPTIDPRYADLRDRGLAVRLSTEDIASDAGADPLERATCRLHRRRLHHCVSSPQHVIAVTGHRWCRTCACAVGIAVDELTGDVRLTCPRCHEAPDSRATRQLVRACRARPGRRGRHRVRRGRPRPRRRRGSLGTSRKDCGRSPFVLARAQ